MSTLASFLLLFILLCSWSYDEGAADRISRGKKEKSKKANKKIVTVPYGRSLVATASNGGGQDGGRHGSSSDDLFAYDVTLPTPFKIDDGLPVSLARGSFTPQCKTTLINGRRHTDCRGQNLGPGGDRRIGGEEGPPAMTVRNRLAKLINDETTVLLLADNALGPKIYHGTFSSLSALHSLDLSANRVSSIEAGAFKGVINLSELDLSNNRLASIPIESLTDTPYLQQLKLNNNLFIKKIENDSFIHLKHLQRLELHGCALTTVEPLAFRGVEATLQFLDISGNRLSEMSEVGILDSLRKARFLRSLYLYKNPWRCNCHLRWLKNFVDTQRITYEQDLRETSCGSPKEVFPSSWSELSARQFACAPELLSASKLDILVDERGGKTRIDGALSTSGGVNLTCKVYSDPEVNPVWYKGEHRIHTMSELTEMATTIVISTLPPSSPGPNSPATPPEHVDVTPALFANPPLNYQLYSIYSSGSETKTSVLSISQVNNDTKGNYRCVASNLIGNVTMRVSLSLRAAPKDGAAQDSLVPAAAAATLPSAATQLEPDGSSVESRAAGGRRRLSSVSGLMIGIIIAGLVVFIVVSAVFFYLDYSRKRRWSTLQGLTRGNRAGSTANLGPSEFKSVVVVCPSLCWAKPANWIDEDGRENSKDIDDDLNGDPLASVLDPTSASATTEYLKMEDLGSTPSRSLDPMSSSGGGGGGENASLIVSFPHGRDSIAVNRSEDPLLIHHLPVERVDDEISSQSDGEEESDGGSGHPKRISAPKPKASAPLVDSSASSTSSANNGNGKPFYNHSGVMPIGDNFEDSNASQVLGHSYISYHSNKAHLDEAPDLTMSEEEMEAQASGMYVNHVPHSRRTENGFPASRSCVWPASPTDPDSYAAAALLDAPLVFPVVSAITTSAIPFHPIAPPLQNPLHPCFYGHHNLLSLTDFETLISDPHQHHHHHQTFVSDFIPTDDGASDVGAAPFIVAPPPEFAAHGTRTLPRAHRLTHQLFQETPVSGGGEVGVSSCEVVSDEATPVSEQSQNRPSELSEKNGAPVGGGEGDSGDGQKEGGTFPVYLDRIGTAV